MVTEISLPPLSIWDSLSFSYRSNITRNGKKSLLLAMVVSWMLRGHRMDGGGNIKGAGKHNLLEEIWG